MQVLFINAPCDEATQDGFVASLRIIAPDVTSVI
jgi:hypothetical protein